MQGNEGYLKKLQERRLESKVYKEFQLIGLEIAEALHDLSHKALYIKLAKERDSRDLLRKAKEVSENPNVKNKGAYFMRIIMDESKKNAK
ncbi:MAG: hypothetical protein AAB652_01895 [Patescibacteria group bacterium]